MRKVLLTTTALLMAACTSNVYQPVPECPKWINCDGNTTPLSQGGDDGPDVPDDGVADQDGGDTDQGDDSNTGDNDSGGGSGTDSEDDVKGNASANNKKGGNYDNTGHSDNGKGKGRNNG